MTKKLVVVNLYGGPCSGKSTIAADIFAKLKRLHLDVELVREYVKEKIWELNPEVMQDQVYILGRQHYRQSVLQGQCQVAITDSPVLLTCVYNDLYTHLRNFNPLVVEMVGHYDNLNYLLERPSVYQAKGRVQDEEGAKGIDDLVVEMLDRLGMSYKRINQQNFAEVVLADVMQRLEA